MSGIRAAVVTVSDGVSQGTRPDGSGDTAEALLREAGFDVHARTVLPDERRAIETTLRELADGRAQPSVRDAQAFGAAREVARHRVHP